tara:strand:- start:649 stop:1377 length:729 start_codon:yes stop_codon:yes gene_type:complete
MKKQLRHGYRVIGLAVSAALGFAIPANANDELERPPGPVTGDNPNIGIKYDKKQGLYVTPFSAKLLGLEMADVDESEIFSTLTLQARVYDNPGDGTAQASAWLPEEEAKLVQSGQAVLLDGDRAGEITAVSEKMNGQAEVLLSIADPAGGLKVGKFLSGNLAISSNGPVTVVPEKAIIHSAEGAFAYVDNGGWTVRTPVEVGAIAGGKAEIIDGIYFGDRVVTQPVMALWMTELQLLKSGKA